MDVDSGPPGIVAGQAVWNAAQAGLILLLLCLWIAERRWRTLVLAAITAACLPFAVYLTSPGAWVLTGVLAVACGLTLAREVPDLAIGIADTPARGGPMLARFEVLAFACTLLCSMYNFVASNGLWPHWGTIFDGIAGIVGFTAHEAAVAHKLYTLGLDGLGVPSFIHIGEPVGGFGALVFTLIWTVLPALYVVYFAVLAKLAEKVPGTRVQQVLCLICIVHFLFLTDLVDYRYGRGIANPVAVWAHSLEVFAWRVAILLPIYQKLAGGDWLRGNGRIGVVVHYCLAAWAAFFLAYEVVMLDAIRFYAMVAGNEFTIPKILGRYRPEALGYHGALVLMTFVYGFSAVALRGKRVWAVPVGRAAAIGTVAVSRP